MVVKMKLYIFDSCPFCVRVRALIHLKQIDCDLKYLILGTLPEHLTNYVERFTVPILELPNNQGVIQDSKDILSYLDQLDSKPLFNNYAASPKIDQWLSPISTSIDLLCYPRMRLLELPELSSSKALSMFEHSRPAKLGMSLQQALENTNQLVNDVATHLESYSNVVNVEALLQETQCIEINDLHLFSILRNLTMVDELQLPHLLKRYLKYLSTQTNIPLYTKINAADFSVQLT